MSTRSIVIIGAGIAGLSAGCYARMNGYATQIFEAHNQPGGLCTSWRRRSFTFDGCIHHLAGAGPASKIYTIWDELGVLQRHQMHYFDDLVRVELPDGQGVTIYTDLDRLEGALKSLAPEDGPVIDEYLSAARRFLGFELLAMPLLTARDVPGLIGRLPSVLKWGRITLDQFAERFSNPLLRQAVPTLQYDFANIPVLLHLSFLAGCADHTLGWPSGGSLAFSRTIAQRYQDLGGQIEYDSPVARILVERDRAVGVALDDGAEVRADVVISAADGHSTIFDLLDGQFADGRIRRYYDAAPDAIDMSLCVAMGVARDMSAEPHALTLFLEHPVDIVGAPHDRLNVEIFNFDPALAPEGKTAIKVLLKSSYSFWKTLSADRIRYAEEKQRIAETVIAQLESRFPGLAGQVEVVDVSTPLTIERFSRNWRGLQAWPVPNQSPFSMFGGFTRTLPNLDCFLMTGQWAEAMIGISTAAISGRNAIQTVCRADGRRFRVERPGDAAG